MQANGICQFVKRERREHIIMIDKCDDIAGGEVEGAICILGVAENTNRALHLATGDVVAFVDHDDVLAPFALYELANAIRLHPKAEFFYSVEEIGRASCRERV